MGFYENKYKKIFAGLGITIILISVFFFTKPKKAEAVVPVHDIALNIAFSSWAAAWGVWAGADKAFKALQLPAWTPGLPTNIYQNIAAIKMKEVGLTDPSGTVPIFFTSWDYWAKLVGKMLLRAITQSVVQWIKTGFQGSPLFITNFDQYLLDAADQATGAFFKQYFSPQVYNFICSPFKAQLTLALQSAAYQQQKFSCTLSSVFQNAQNFATNINNGSWDNWIRVTTNPQNNFYGSYLLQMENLYGMQANAQNRAKTESLFNNGFLSMKKCVEWYADEWTGPGKDGKGTCTRYENTSPGKWISDQLSSATGIDFTELALADELNEIIQALISQGISMLLSETLGGSAGENGILGGKLPAPIEGPPSPFPSPSPQNPQCSDLMDNDLDGLTDYPADPDCTSASDTSEGATQTTSNNCPVNNDPDPVLGYCVSNSNPSNTCSKWQHIYPGAEETYVAKVSEANKMTFMSIDVIGSPNVQAYMNAECFLTLPGGTVFGPVRLAGDGSCRFVLLGKKDDFYGKYNCSECNLPYDYLPTGYYNLKIKQGDCGSDNCSPNFLIQTEGTNPINFYTPGGANPPACTNNSI